MAAIYAFGLVVVIKRLYLAYQSSIASARRTIIISRRGTPFIIKVCTKIKRDVERAEGVINFCRAAVCAARSQCNC